MFKALIAGSVRLVHRARGYHAPTREERDEIRAQLADAEARPITETEMIAHADAMHSHSDPPDAEARP